MWKMQGTKSGLDDTMYINIDLSKTGRGVTQVPKIKKSVARPMLAKVDGLDRKVLGNKM